MDIPELSERQKKILQLTVQEFVKTGEPVSSSSIAGIGSMICSSATIRHEMAKLEEMGFLRQLHSASGRIPLDTAYRVFVNEIIKNRIEPPPKETAEAIQREYNSVKAKTELLLEKTAEMLSRITSYTSMALGPQIRKHLIKYLKLIPLSESAILLFLASDTGEIINKIIELSEPPDPVKLDKLTDSLNKRLLGKPIEDLGPVLENAAGLKENKKLIEDISKESDKLLSAPSREIIVSGKNKVFDFSEESDLKSVKIMMELLEEETIIAEILSKTIENGDINIMIGSENPVSEMKNCTIITVTYKIKSSPAGTIGLLGPKRMPYRQILSIINYTAENIGDKLSSIDSAMELE